MVCAIIKYLGNEKDIVIPEMVDGHKVVSLGAGWNSKLIFADKNSTSDITSVVMPNRVIVIQDNAFVNCTKLTNIVIPDGVTFIGFGAFFNGSCLKEIYIPDTVTVLSDPNCYDWFYKNQAKPKIQTIRKNQKTTDDYPSLFDQDFFQTDERKMMISMLYHSDVTT